MDLVVRGQEVECIELYPCMDEQRRLESVAFAIVGRGGRTLVSDTCLRRDHQTPLGLLMETVTMVRNCCAEGL